MNKPNKHDLFNQIRVLGLTFDEKCELINNHRRLELFKVDTDMSVRIRAKIKIRRLKDVGEYGPENH